jgi:hypothetical protein
MKLKVHKTEKHKLNLNKHGDKEIVAFNQNTGDWTHQDYIDIAMDPDLYTHFFFYKEMN